MLTASLSLTAACKRHSVSSTARSNLEVQRQYLQAAGWITLPFDLSSGDGAIWPRNRGISACGTSTHDLHIHDDLALDR